MTVFYLLTVAGLFATAIAVFLKTIRPLPPLLLVGLCVLSLPIIGAMASDAFADAQSSDTMTQLFIVAISAAWIAAVRPMPFTYSTHSGSLVLKATGLEKPSMTTAGAAALVLAVIISLQASSAAAGVRSAAADVGALASFAVCFGCWTVIASSLTLPWKVHSRWTLPTLMMTLVLFVVMIPATWLANSRTVATGAAAPAAPPVTTDNAPPAGQPIVVYPDPGRPSADFPQSDPLSSATSPSRTLLYPLESGSTASSAQGDRLGSVAAPTGYRPPDLPQMSLTATFGVSGGVVASNLIAVLAVLFAFAKIVSRRYANEADPHGGDLKEYVVRSHAEP